MRDADLYRGTTPGITFKLNTNIDLSQISILYVTFKTMFVEETFTKEDCDVDNDKKTITVRFSQEQTLKFIPGEINVQIRFKVGNDRAYSTPIKTITVGQILKDGVI